MAIGSHTRTHPSLAGLAAARAREEMVPSRDALQTILGKDVDFLAYPYGESSDATHELAAESGYLAFCTVEGGLNDPGTLPYALRRLEVQGTDGLVRSFSSNLGVRATHMAVQSFIRVTPEHAKSANWCSGYPRRAENCGVHSSGASCHVCRSRRCAMPCSWFAAQLSSRCAFAATRHSLGASGSPRSRDTTSPTRKSHQASVWTSVRRVDEAEGALQTCVTAGWPALAAAVGTVAGRNGSAAVPAPHGGNAANH
jgi:hypothetical protein